MGREGKGEAGRGRFTGSLTKTLRIGQGQKRDEHWVLALSFQ